MAMTQYPDDPQQRLRKRIGAQVAGQMPAPIGAPDTGGSAPLPSAPFAPTASTGVRSPRAGSNLTIGDLPEASGDVPNPFPTGGGEATEVPPIASGPANPFPMPPISPPLSPAPPPYPGGPAAPSPPAPQPPGAPAPSPGQPNPNPGHYPSPPIDNTPPGATPSQPSGPPTAPDRQGNTPGTPAHFSPQQVADIVNDWMAHNNPYHHGDASYWINKIVNADNGGATQANIDYFKGRFLEDPNNNPHSPQNQPGAGGGGGTSGTVPKGGVWTDAMQQLRDLIMARLAQAGSPIDVNAPNITEPVTAARNEATRSSEQERSALAERLYAQGGGALDTNAINQNIQQSAERNAASVGGLRANLIMGEVNAKRQEFQQLLQMALAAGDAEAARNIQMAMADLEATLRREGWGIDLAKFQAQLDQNAALAGLG